MKTESKLFVLKEEPLIPPIQRPAKVYTETDGEEWSLRIQGMLRKKRSKRQEPSHENRH